MKKSHPAFAEEFPQLATCVFNVMIYKLGKLIIMTGTTHILTILAL
jgi:hypothetical protein